MTILAGLALAGAVLPSAPAALPEGAAPQGPAAATGRDESENAFGRAVADGELAEQRGGFALPNGLTLALGIDIQARVDGRTIYSMPVIGVGGANGTLTKEGITTDDGARTPLQFGSDGGSIRFAADALQITQTFGRAAGIMIANAGHDRTIEMHTTITAQLNGLAAARQVPMLPALRVITQTSIRP